MGLLSSVGKFWFNTTPLGMTWNAVSGIWKSGKEVVKEGVSTIKDATSSIKGSISSAASPSKVYDGGFAGMSETAVEEVKAQIKKYVEEIQSSVSSFDEGKEIDTFLKGDTNTAAREYVRAVKELMETYLNSLNKIANELDFYYAQFKSQTGEIAKTTMNSVDSLRSQAANKPLD